MDYVNCFNAVEAIWWIVVAAAVTLGRFASHGVVAGPRWTLAAALVAFGVSDVIEIQTGAWWRPVGLLLLKACCIVVFIASIVAIAVRRQSAIESSSKLDRHTDPSPESCRETTPKA